MQPIVGKIILLLLGLISNSFARSILFENNQIDGNDSSSASSEEDLRDVLDQIQTACYEQTGSNDTYDTIKLHFYGAPVCVLMNMDVFNFVQDLETLDDNNRNDFFPKYCPQMRHTLECVEPVLRNLRKCLPEEDALVLRAISHAMPEAIDLICDKNGEILFVEGANYTTCIDGFSNYIDECGGKISNATNAMHFSNYGQAQCDELGNFRKCLTEKMNHCNGPQLMDIFDVLYRAIVRASPCVNMIILPHEKSTEKTSLTTIESV